jgi:putative Holliday junction resolvase
MGRILGIDYGTKRVGVAETDDFKLIASPLTTIHAKDVVTFIKNYAEQYELEAVVVGEPKGLNNQKTDASEFVDQFITRLSRSIKGIKIIREDERFTSKIAARSLLESGLKKSKRQEKGNLDKVSAAIILQSYLDKLSRT